MGLSPCRGFLVLILKVSSAFLLVPATFYSVYASSISTYAGALLKNPFLTHYYRPVVGTVLKCAL